MTMRRRNLANRCETLERWAKELRRPEELAQQRHDNWVEAVVQLFGAFPDERHVTRNCSNCPSVSVGLAAGLRRSKWTSICFKRVALGSGKWTRKKLHNPRIAVQFG